MPEKQLEPTQATDLSHAVADWENENEEKDSEK